MSTADDLDLKVGSLIERIRARTPARLLAGRAGSGYTTATQLSLREDHAAARDAVWNELDLQRDLKADFVQRWGLFEVSTLARNKQEYLLNPGRGRELTSEARDAITGRCSRHADLQIVIGDGLSARAVCAQVPGLLPLLVDESKRRGWSVGQTFVVRHCRVGVMNDIGEILHPKVLVLLIGERPGMSTAESLSAYMGWQPRTGHTDGDRNLISNIHARGISAQDAAMRIAELAAEFMRLQRSGARVKEPEPRSLSPADEE